jgi:glycosyltransferase involved in cell wall biosynthesis
LYGLELLSSLSEKNPQLKIMLIGPEPTTGNVTSDLQNFKKSNQSSKIEIRGWVSDSELSSLIKNAKLVLYPSNSEGFGFVPFEAAKLGTPAIFARNSSMKELFNEVPIYLTYERDADLRSISSLLSNENKWNEQLAYIRTRGTDLTWEKTAYLTSVFLSSILKKPLALNSRTKNVLRSTVSSSPKEVLLSVGGSMKFILNTFPPYTRRRRFLKKVAVKIFN